jgi:hypothetical protein
MTEVRGAGPEGHSSLADFVGLKPHASTVILAGFRAYSHALPRSFSLASTFVPDDRGAGPEGHSLLANFVGLKPHASTLFSRASALIPDDRGAGPEGHSSLAKFVGLKPHASTVVLAGFHVQ